MATIQDETTTPGRTARRGRWRRAGWVAGIFGVLALGAAVALSIATGKPVIGLAAGTGLALVGVLVLLVRVRWRARWVIIIGSVVLIVGAWVVGNSLINNPAALPCCPGSVGPSLTVDYHASGRLVADTVSIDESIILDQEVMAAIGRSIGSSGDPIITIPGWRDSGLVDGQPSLSRSRTFPWSQMSVLADGVMISLKLGSLSASVGNNTYSATLAPQPGSRMEFVLAKGAIGTTAPAVTTRTDGLSGTGEETVTFAVDRYVSDVSFDVLSEPLRNPAGRAVYEASLWGFWQWAAGAIGAVVSGLIVDKVGEGLWRALTAIFRRRRVAATP